MWQRIETAKDAAVLWEAPPTPMSLRNCRRNWPRRGLPQILSAKQF